MDMNEEAALKTPRRFGVLSYQRPSRRCLIIIVAIFVLCVLCIVLATTLSRKSQDNCPSGIHCDWRSMPTTEFLKDERCESTCTTAPCIRSADFALRRIDSTKDPCDDFYEFACGKFEKEALLFPDTNDAALTYHEAENELMLHMKDVIDSIPYTITGTATDLLLLAKKFYVDCMSTERHVDDVNRNALTKLIPEVGVTKWPLPDGRLVNDELLAKVMSLSIFYDANPFISLSFVGERGEKGEKDFKLMFHFNNVDPEQLTYLHSGSGDAKAFRYQTLIDKILHESGIDVTEVPKVSSGIMEFEKKFKEAASKPLESLPRKVPQHMDIPKFDKFECQALERRMNAVKWCKVVEHLLEEMGRPTDTAVQLRFPDGMEYYDAMDKVMSQDRRAAVHYIVVKFLMDHLKYMPSPFRELYYQNLDLFPRDNMYRTLPARWQQCVDAVTEFFWIPLEVKYATYKVLEDDVKKITVMHEKMKDAYASAVAKTTWLSREEKEYISEEAERMEMFVGNSKLWQSAEGKMFTQDVRKMMKTTSSRLFTTSHLTFLEDALEMKKLLRRGFPGATGFRLWKSSGQFKIFEPKNKGPHIRVPYGVLHFPIYLAGRPMFVEFAMLGKQLLHGLSNSFFLSAASVNATEIQELFPKCLLDRFNASAPQDAASKDAESRILSNFYSTWTSLVTTEAYLEYLKENGEEKGLPGLPLSNEQLFFVSLAQVNCEKFSGERYKNYPTEYFSSSRERVNVALANSEEFSEAFVCPSGSKMNPKAKFGVGKVTEECE